MITHAATVCAALLADSAVKAVIGDNLFAESPPSEAAFPCVTYAESNAPALGADDAEILTSVFFNMECWSRSDAWPLAIKVNRVMAGLGYSRDSAQDAGSDINGLHQINLKFSTIKEG